MKEDLEIDYININIIFFNLLFKETIYLQLLKLRYTN
jgi:hypothetical protein